MVWRPFRTQIRICCPSVSQAASHRSHLEERQGCTSSSAVSFTLNLAPTVCRSCSSLSSSISIESLGTNSHTWTRQFTGTLQSRHRAALIEAQFFVRRTGQILWAISRLHCDRLLGPSLVDHVQLLDSFYRLLMNSSFPLVSCHNVRSSNASSRDNG